MTTTYPDQTEVMTGVTESQAGAYGTVAHLTVGTRQPGDDQYVAGRGLCGAVLVSLTAPGARERICKRCARVGVKPGDTFFGIVTIPPKNRKVYGMATSPWHMITGFTDRPAAYKETAALVRGYRRYARNAPQPAGKVLPVSRLPRTLAEIERGRATKKKANAAVMRRRYPGYR